MAQPALKTIRIPTMAPMNSRRSLLLIYTGGTMGMYADPQTGSLTPLDFEQITYRIPELFHLPVNLTVVAFTQPVDSSDMNAARWALLSSVIVEHYDQYDGFVVLHGTDTMAYTASMLSYMLGNLGKPVIFTGSQLPLGVARNDARENILTALEIASTQKEGRALVPEVCIYFANVLLRGNRAKKEESNDFLAFSSPNFPALAEAGIEIKYNENLLLPPKEGSLNYLPGCSENVFAVRLFPEMNWKVLATVLENPQLKGLVLETFGSGNAPNAPEFLQLLEKACQRGVIIYNVSQCRGGRVNQGHYASSSSLGKIGVISGHDITTEAALTKLMWLLGNGFSDDEVKSLLVSNLAGEMEL